LRLQPSALWKSREPDVLLDILLKRLPRKQQRTVSTHKRSLLGIPRRNRHGSLKRSSWRKFNRHSRKPQLPLSQRGLEYRAGTPVGFAKATVLIHGIGRNLNGWLGFRWASRIALLRLTPQSVFPATLNCWLSKTWTTCYTFVKSCLQPPFSC